MKKVLLLASLALALACPTLTLAQTDTGASKPLDLSLTAIDGSKIDFPKLRGKVVIVDFWATWCPPCVRGVPHLVAAYNKYHKQGLEIVGISQDADKAQLTDFTKENHMPWPQYMDPQDENNLGNRLGVNGYPTMVLVNKEGQIVAAGRRVEDLVPDVEKLLQK